MSPAFRRHSNQESHGTFPCTHRGLSLGPDLCILVLKETLLFQLPPASQTIPTFSWGTRFLS